MREKLKKYLIIAAVIVIAGLYLFFLFTISSRAGSVNG
jgi:hypothetical protein